MRPQYVILGEFLRTGERGKFDVLGVFDRIFARSVPAQHQHLALAVLLVAESEDDFGTWPFRMYLESPTKGTVFEQHGQIEMRPTAGTWLATARLMFNVSGMPVPEYGKYHFVLEVDGKKVADHPLTVARPGEEAG